MITSIAMFYYKVLSPHSFEFFTLQLVRFVGLLNTFDKGLIYYNLFSKWRAIKTFKPV